ncbi:MAG: hypothetical protein QNI86_08225 [Halieaceae bacterium]|nr:hypothetical protein [Halieaceae bacterium]
MNTSKTRFKQSLLVLGCSWAIAVGPAHARISEPAEVRPKINLFPTSVVENLSATSRAARDMESGMYEVVAKLEKQKHAYESTHCENSSDPGCLQLRKAIRGSYKEMLDVMQASIPKMRASLDSTVDSMGTSLRSEIGRKMTPGDVQRILGGRTASVQGMSPVQSKGSRQGKLSKMFARYYELVKRGGQQSDSLPVLASQIYMDSMQSMYFLDLIEAEIGSQSTELVLELEWGELTDQISATVGDVKSLLWGDVDQAREIPEIGLEEESAQDKYQDLLVN